MFRQPWLKTLPVSYLSNISTSEKLLVSMARLLDPRGSIIRPPCWTAASLCNLLVNISKMPNAEMRARSSYMEKLTPGSGGAAIRRSPSNKVEVPWIVLLVFVACISFSLHGCWQSTMSSFQWSHTKNGCMLFSGIASYPSPSQPNVSQLRRYAGSQSLPRPPLAAGWWWQPQEDERQRLWTAHAQCKTNQGAMQQCETNHGCQVFTKCI